MKQHILNIIMNQVSSIVNNEDNYKTIVIGYTLKGKNKMFKNKSKRKKVFYKAYELCNFEPITDIWSM